MPVASDLTKLRAAMTAGLVAKGVLRSEPWREAFNSVPRHVFLSRFYRQTDNAGWRAIDPSHPQWCELVYRDETCVIQINYDDALWEIARDRPVPGSPTSSSTAPGLMALMVEALDLRPEHKVLEIGTATGYHAALLSHRLAAQRVTSIEYDPGIFHHARDALHRAGYQPTLLCGDGAYGAQESAPFDRIIATCSFPAIPPAWRQQVRPGGVILTNLSGDLGGGALVRLTVGESGTAHGRFLPRYGQFMPGHVPLSTHRHCSGRRFTDPTVGHAPPSSVRRSCTTRTSEC